MEHAIATIFGTCERVWSLPLGPQREFRTLRLAATGRRRGSRLWLILCLVNWSSAANCEEHSVKVVPTKKPERDPSLELGMTD